MARLKYWVWLSCVGGVRPITKYRLCEAMDGPEKLFFAGRDEILAAGATEAEADRLADKSMAGASRAISSCAERGITILTLQDATYPERLRNIPDPPVVLYVWGQLPAVDEHLLIAVIGTRRPSPYGMRMAAKLGGELTEGGGIVVSGLAEGCDSAAMEAALRAGGRTVGVLGTAIDVVYPAKHRSLFEAVKANGALVSEYAPGMRTFPADFKARNRIISGLSVGVVVAEAPIRSGTRVTANFALDQGRDVFAVPGNADAASMAGCNDLLAHGAIVTTCGADIFAEYRSRNDLLPQKMTATPIKKEIDKPKDIVYIDLSEAPENLPADQRAILRAMTRSEMHADEIIEATGLPAAAALAALTMLQVTGYITQSAGRRYTRKQ